MVRRTRTEIIEEILAEARMGKPKSTIMYECGFNYGQLNRYVRWLVEKGYLDEEENPDYRKKGKDINIKTVCTTTEAGWHYLNALEKLRAGKEEVEKFL